MPAKIVVKPYRGGSRVSLLGSSGKELLASSVFKEPRAKGATLRALKGLLGEDVVVEDHTVVAAKKAAAKTAPAAAAVPAEKVAAAVTAPAKRVTKKVSAVKAAAPAKRGSTRPAKKA